MFPPGSPHARALRNCRILGELGWSEEEAAASPLFREELAKLRPVVDCSGDVVITKPEAEPGTDLKRILAQVQSGMIMAPSPDVIPDGVFDFEQSMLDNFLIQRRVGEFASLESQKAARIAADAKAEAEKLAADAAAQEAADLKEAIADFRASRARQKEMLDPKGS